MSAPIQSLIVLMLENRSFDHMLGFLDHPSSAFPRLTGEESNVWEPGRPPQRVTPDAGPTLEIDPAHHHADVMLQMFGRSDVPDAPPRNSPVTNTGFALSFEQAGIREKKQRQFGPRIMACQSPDRIPALATLAREFAVCTKWFSSVPGETWPNRNFAHAGTSDGEVNIRVRFYDNDTIYDRLTANRSDWGIYHEGVPQVAAFKKLWTLRTGNRFHDHEQLLWAIQHDVLPNYAFVEPDHFPPFSGSQHPTNNRKNGKDFHRAEQLIERIYESLAANPAVFEKTLFLVTYDEHGGFFDREAPPSDPSFQDGRKSEDGFPFDLLGPRVPAVLVSPWISRGTVDPTVYDHSSIAATVRALMMPGAETLSPREARANTFEHNLTLTQPRRDADLPRLSPTEPADAVLAGFNEADALDHDELTEFGHSLVWLTRRIRTDLELEGRISSAVVAESQLEAAVAASRNPASTMSFAIEQRQVAAMLQTSAAPDIRARIDGHLDVIRLSSADELSRQAAGLLRGSGVGEAEAHRTVRVYGRNKAMLTVRPDSTIEFHENDRTYTSPPLSRDQIADGVRLYRLGEMSALWLLLGG